jgi:urease accessory protein
MLQVLPRECSTTAQSRQRADFQFARTDRRTHLARQFVSYPFHVTRPFYLDREPAGLATLYLQSSSGGIYSGDSLELTIEAAAGAQCQVTSQSSTIVHDCRGRTSRYATRIHAASGAFIGLCADPLILFPGAAIEMQADVRLEPDAAVIIADGLVLHDPVGGGREPFAQYSSELTVTEVSGRRLLVDRLRVSGAEFARLAPHGSQRMAGSVFALGRLPAVSPADLEAGVAATGSYAGATRLPNEAGLAVRLLAPDGAALARGLARAWEILFTGLFGTPPGRRRK